MTVLLLVPVCSTQAQNQKAASPTAPAAKAKKKTDNEVSEERKQELLGFVREHHVELEDMLKRLESGKRWQYRQAINGLHRSVSKLEKLKQRNPQRYQSALEQWKIESRISVAAAQYRVEETDQLRTKLETLISELVDLNLQRLKDDRQQLENRMQQMDKRIDEMESGRDKMIQNRLKAAIRTRKANNNSNKKKPSSDSDGKSG